MKFRSRRKPTDFDVLLVSEDSEHVAHVVDVNDQGVRVRSNAPIYSTEDDLFLQFRGKKYATRIAWAKDNELGLQFDQALPDDIRALIARDSKPKATRKRFLLR